MEINMNPLHKQMLDDVFDAFSMFSNGGFVSLMHVEGGFTRYSPLAVELMELPGEYIPNGAMDFNDYLHPEDRKRYMDVMLPLMEGKTQTYDITYRIRINTGEYANFRAVGAVLRGADGKPSLIGGVTYNQGQTENTDPVTVLPNKNVYLTDLTKMMEAGKTTVSLQVGINDFTEINKVHGFTYGNRLLQEIAWLLQETVEDRASVYRLDGASFALLFETISRGEIAAIYDHIQYSLQRGIELNGVLNNLVANAGLISTYNADASADTILSCLNYAYRESQENNHGDLVDFNGSIHQDGDDKLKQISAIRESIMDGCKGFHMEYEPVINPKTNWMNGGEATIYWEDETYGKVSASEFLPILERDYVFEELSDFILQRSLADGVKFLETDPDFLLCVDIYRMQLESDYFIEDLLEAIDNSGFPAGQLSLNFSGDYRSVDKELMALTIEKLHEKGILIIIDGFGSGRDSVGFLKEFPVDAVSLDIRFIEGVEESERNRNILMHLTQLAYDCVDYINIRGIASKRLLEIVKDFPITTIEGPYFAESVTAEQIIETYHRDVFLKDIPG